MTKELVKENVTRHDSSCENSLPPVELTFVRGRVEVGGNSHEGRALTSGCNTRELVNNRNPLQIGRGRSEEFPLLLERARERVGFNHSGTSQSLINVKHLFAYSPIGLFASKRSAFTLAEVLVTLAVIGIVAVMTIPNLVQNYQSKSWDTASKVFDRKLTEALKVMNVQGTLAGYTRTEDFVNELSKHLKITKTCTNSNLTACFSNTVMWGKDNEEIDISKLKTAKDFGQEENSKNWGANTNIVGFQLANGVTGLMAYNTKCTQDEYSNQITGGDCLAVLYDVQGYAKPNTAGKDLRNTNIVALGSKKACDVEFDNHCWTISGTYTPMSFSECTGNTGSVNSTTAAGDAAKALGIKQCYYDNDYWAGAVKACGGTTKMPTPDQLAKLATQIYGQEIGAKEDKSGLTIKDQTLFDALHAKSPTATSSSFYVWSSEESDSYSAYGRLFGDTCSNYNDGNRYYGSTILAVCLGD